MKTWTELTENQQWAAAYAAAKIREKYEYLKELALEDAEDGCGEALIRVNRAIEAEINQMRRSHGLEPL